MSGGQGHSHMNQSQAQVQFKRRPSLTVTSLYSLHCALPHRDGNIYSRLLATLLLFIFIYIFPLSFILRKLSNSLTFVQPLILKNLNIILPCYFCIYFVTFFPSSLFLTKCTPLYPYTPVVGCRYPGVPKLPTVPDHPGHQGAGRGPLQGLGGEGEPSLLQAGGQGTEQGPGTQ